MPELKTHTISYGEELANITSRINTTNKTINENIKLLEIKEVTESFLRLQEQLEEVSVKSTATSIIDKAKNFSFLGSMIKKAEHSVISMQSVYSTLDRLFTTTEVKYNKLVEVGTALQEGKQVLELQITQLQALEEDIVSKIELYKDANEVPLSLLSTHTQAGTYLTKYKSRLMKVEASIFAAKQTIQQLGAYLPTFKSELNDELALSGLLQQVGDYQSMFQTLSKLVKEIGDINDAKAHSAITDLLDIQINDTTTRDVLVSLKTRADKFATDITTKTAALHNKIRADHEFYDSMASSSLISNTLASVKKLTQ